MLIAAQPEHCHDFCHCPHHNEEKVLPGTLRALVDQPGDYEVIVVDGGSSDRTKAVLEAFGFVSIPLPLAPHVCFWPPPKGAPPR